VLTEGGFRQGGMKYGTDAPPAKSKDALRIFAATS
jgi:hypothetical protein